MELITLDNLDKVRELVGETLLLKNQDESSQWLIVIESIDKNGSVNYRFINTANTYNNFFDYETEYREAMERYSSKLFYGLKVYKLNKEELDYQHSKIFARQL